MPSVTMVAKAMMPTATGPSPYAALSSHRGFTSRKRSSNALYQVESGENVVEVCRRLGVSDQTFR